MRKSTLLVGLAGLGLAGAAIFYSSAPSPAKREPTLYENVEPRQRETNPASLERKVEEAIVSNANTETQAASSQDMRTPAEMYLDNILKSNTTYIAVDQKHGQVRNILGFEDLCTKLLNMIPFGMLQEGKYEQGPLSVSAYLDDNQRRTLQVDYTGSEGGSIRMNLRGFDKGKMPIMHVHITGVDRYEESVAIERTGETLSRGFTQLEGTEPMGDLYTALKPEEVGNMRPWAEQIRDMIYVATQTYFDPLLSQKQP